MLRIIKTVVTSSWPESVDVIGSLLSESQLLSKNEVDCLLRIQSDYKDGGVFSSRALLTEQFPSIMFGWDNTDSLESITDLKLYVSRFLSDRKKLKASDELLKLSDLVQKKGLTVEDLENLRAFLTEEPAEKKNPLDFDFLEDFRLEQAKDKGYKTFVPEIDEQVRNGFDTGGLISIFAFTSQFKTTFAQNICYKNAAEGKNSVYISLEVPKRMIQWKMLLSFAQSRGFKIHPTYWDVFTNADWTTQNNFGLYDYLFQEISEKFKNLPGKIIVYDESDFPQYTEAAFRRKLEEADDLVEGNLHGVFWDQASLLKFNDNKRSYSYAGEAINHFIDFIRKLGSTFRKDKNGNWRLLTNFVLAQANRQSFLNVAKETEDPGRYALTGIAEANEIERASWYVMSVFANEDLRQKKQATTQLLKNRNGRVIEDPIRVFCDGRTGLFGSELDIRDIRFQNENYSNSTQYNQTTPEPAVPEHDFSTSSPFDDIFGENLGNGF